jgi:hypothetical protein
MRSLPLVPKLHPALKLTVRALLVRRKKPPEVKNSVVSSD